MPNETKGRPKRRHEGYMHKSPAVCVVVHDPAGRAMPDKIAAEIINRVTDIALREGYLVNFTRT